MEYTNSSLERVEMNTENKFPLGLYQTLCLSTTELLNGHLNVLLNTMLSRTYANVEDDKKADWMRCLYVAQAIADEYQELNDLVMSMAKSHLTPVQFTEIEEGTKIGSRRLPPFDQNAMLDRFKFEMPGLFLENCSCTKDRVTCGVQTEIPIAKPVQDITKSFGGNYEDSYMAPPTPASDPVTHNTPKSQVHTGDIRHKTLPCIPVPSNPTHQISQIPITKDLLKNIPAYATNVVTSASKPTVLDSVPFDEQPLNNSTYFARVKVQTYKESPHGSYDWPILSPSPRPSSLSNIPAPVKGIHQKTDQKMMDYDNSSSLLYTASAKKDLHAQKMPSPMPSSKIPLSTGSFDETPLNNSRFLETIGRIGDNTQSGYELGSLKSPIPSIFPGILPSIQPENSTRTTKTVKSSTSHSKLPRIKPVIARSETARTHGFLNYYKH